MGSPRRQLRGRYDPAELALRVERLRVARGVEVKAIEADLGISRFDWSRKVRLSKNTFTVRELGALADYFRAPPGWPFLPYEIGEALERMLAGRGGPES